MTIRVIAGSAKGRRLKMVPGDTTRPVMDRVKEACFNILGRRVVGASFLDVFAGTGSVGIEALSRGARRAVFFEIDRKAIKVIQDNLQATRLGERAVVQRGDALLWLRQTPIEVFDFIYIAPPQYKELWRQTLDILDHNSGWAAEQAVIIVQIDPFERQTVALEHFQLYDERRYGSTLLLFFSHQETPAEAVEKKE